MLISKFYNCNVLKFAIVLNSESKVLKNLLQFSSLLVDLECEKFLKRPLVGREYENHLKLSDS